MTTVVQSLRSITVRGLDALTKIRFVLIGIICVGLGVSFGYLINNPDAGWLIISLIVILMLLLIIVNKPLNGVFVWLFFKVFLDSWIEIPMGAGIPDLSFSRFVIIFLAIFMLAQAAIGKFRFARIGWAEFFIVGTVVGIMTAAPLSIQPDPKGVVQWVVSLYFTPMVIYFFAKNLVKDKEDLHKLLWTIAVLGFVSGTYAIYEYVTHDVLFVAKDKIFDNTDIFRGGTDIWHIKGIMGGPGAMGQALAISISVTFYLFLESKKTGLLRKFLSVGMLVIQFYGIVVAMKRAPWYALLIALFVMQVFYPKFRKLFWVIAVVAAVVIWSTWDQVSQSQVSARVSDKVSTLEGREARWQAGFNMWKAKPIRGWGFGWYQIKAGQFRTDGDNRNFENGAIENDYLYILVGSGLIGLLPYLLFLIGPLISSLRLFFRARAPDWPGFVKPETFAVYWAVILCLTITAYTQVQIQPTIRLMTFAVAGAVVGSHEYLLRGAKADSRRQAELSRQVNP